MKTKTAIRISTMLIALALAGASHAQLKEPPIPGTYYSAKDFEWMPPWPFNPNPELEAVEVEPGIFVFDDTMIPDTPEQAAGRAAHQAAVEHAQLLAANPALAEAERTARQAAQEAAWKSSREARSVAGQAADFAKRRADEPTRQGSSHPVQFAEPVFSPQRRASSHA